MLGHRDYAVGIHGIHLGCTVVLYTGLPSFISSTVTDLVGEPDLSMVNLPVTPSKVMPATALRTSSRVAFSPAF